MSNALFPQNAIITVDATASTNSYAKELVVNKTVTSNSVILTQKQLCGRGQQHNFWESEHRKNLTISVVLFPNFLPAQYQFYLSMVIALSVYDYLTVYLDNVTIKWPNDIYIDNKKISGILIENTISGGKLKYAICGIGLNINQEKFYSDAPNPVSFCNCTGNTYDLNKALQDLLQCVEKRYQQLESGEYEQLNSDYLNVLYRKGELHRFQDDNGIFKGKITGITDFGQLQIRVDNTERVYNFKEVEFLK